VVEIDSVPLARLRGLGFDPELVIFTARCAVSGVLTRLPAAEPVGDRATAAFVAGFLCGVSVHEGQATCAQDAADVIAGAARAVAERGRHAIIADHCDLSATSSLENAFADELSAGLDESDQVRPVLLYLYECGLAIGLAACSRSVARA